MAATHEGQGHQGHPQHQVHQGPQPVVVHVHVHMHNEEKTAPPPPPPQPQHQPHEMRYNVAPREPPILHSSPHSFLHRTLPQPRYNQLPRLVYTDDTAPVPVYTQQTPRLVQQEYSPRRLPTQYGDILGVAATTADDDGDNNNNNQVRYVYRESRPVERLAPRQRYHTIAANGHDMLPRKQLQERSQVDYNNSRAKLSTDVTPIFRPGYSEKYVRNVKRETVVKPGVRLPNTVSIKSQETSSNNSEDIDRKLNETVNGGRTVYRPLKDVFTDKHDGPVSFELRKPRFPYKFSNSRQTSRSMSSLDGKTHDKHEVFERAKNRAVFKDDATGKTFRIHSMLPIQEEQQRSQSESRRYYDDNCRPPVYRENPAAPRTKRYSMPAGLANFRLDNMSPAYEKLSREAEETEQLQAILDMTEKMLKEHT